MLMRKSRTRMRTTIWRMKANELPELDEIIDFVDPPDKERIKTDFHQVKCRAIRVVELFLDEQVRNRKIKLRMMVGNGQYRLLHFPVRNFTIVEFPEGPYQCAEETGLLFSELPTGNYTLTYEVGYLPGNVPAIVKELVKELMLYELIDKESYRESVIRMIQIAREIRRRRDKERRAYETA